MTLFLLLLLIAVALGIPGATVPGMTWLLVLGVLVLVADLVFLGVRMGRRGGRRVTR